MNYYFITNEFEQEILEVVTKNTFPNLLFDDIHYQSSEKWFYFQKSSFTSNFPVGFKIL